MHIFAFLAIVHYLPFTINCSSPTFDVVGKGGRGENCREEGDFLHMVHKGQTIEIPKGLEQWSVALEHPFSWR
jgi:hypothetical protein